MAEVQNPSVVSSIHIYPVKSCQGTSVESAKLTPWGLEHDRRWAVVRNLYKKPEGADVDLGVIETQFDMNPFLAAIQTSIQNGYLVLRAPGMKSDLSVRIQTEPNPARRCQVGAVQRTKLPFAEDEGVEAAKWLTDYLQPKVGEAGESFHLVWCPPNASRSLKKDPRYGALYSDPSGLESTAFADTAQYHIASESSLKALNDKIVSGGHNSVQMSRFRANIVVADGGLTPAWDEDTWKVVRVGENSKMRMRVCMPDLRCHVTSINQEGPNAGLRDKAMQPLKALKAMRKGVLRKGMVFGVKLNNIVDDNLGLYAPPPPGSDLEVIPALLPMIRVGDTFEVVERTAKSLCTIDLDEMRRSLSICDVMEVATSRL